MSLVQRARSYAATRNETGFRSKLEVLIAQRLDEAGLQRGEDYDYETVALPFHKPATYRPDFILHRQAIIVEAKGLFESEDRTKMLLVKQRYPDLDIRFVFSNPQAKLFKRSATTYAKWAAKNGFPWAVKEIPIEWLNHKPTPKAQEALKKFLP